MRITFLVRTSDNKLHILQHETRDIDRPTWQSNRKINVELEWERFLTARPEVIDRLQHETRNIDPPSLIGALDSKVRGQVVWFEGVEIEPHREKEV